MSRDNANPLVHATQMGCVVRKQFNQAQDRWEVAIGVKNQQEAVVLGFSYKEMEAMLKAIYAVMDTFTEHEKRVGFADRIITTRK